MEQEKVKCQILEFKLKGASQREEVAADHCVNAVKRQNKLTCEIVRLRHANSQLLLQLHAVHGYPARLMLPAPEVNHVR